MKVCVIIIVMVIQAITCEKAVSKLQRKLIVPKMNEKCKKIKCAAVDEPQCVRMRRLDLSLTIHVIAANKCELEYMKCHDDVEANLVPMKYCGHNGGQTAGEEKNKSGKARIRVKRRVKTIIKPIQRDGDIADSSTIEQPKSTTEQPISTTEQPRSTTEQPRSTTEQPRNNNNKTKHSKLKKSRINSHKLRLLWKNEDTNVISKDKDNRSTLKGHGAEHHARQGLGFPFSSEDDSDIEYNERKKLKKGVAGYLLDMQAEDADSSNVQLEPKAFIAPSVIAWKGNSPQPLSEVESNFWGSEEIGPEFPMLSGEADNFSKESLTKADKTEYEEMCPTVCPSRDVMVCGKCQHGIYKTFTSVCALRMFTCNHEEEILQLISRYPCVLSAPYIPDSSTKPKGRIQEPSDDDKVLRFIMCRSQGKLGTDKKPPEDPRCNFRPTKEQLKYYDFRGVNMQLDLHMLHHDSSEY